jgi:tetratricopeptide (TPR) repeat protein
MSQSKSSLLPRLTPEQRLSAAGQFERANQVLMTGNLDYGMQLLVNCCLIDPGNPTYRQALRNAQKTKYKNSGKGQSMSALTTLPAKLKMKTALGKGNYFKVLEHAEEVCMRNPWDLGTHLAMAQAFEKLELPGMAIWTLDQVRQVDGNNPAINRPLARLFEKAGNFTTAIVLWEKVRQAVPDDVEAQHKHKDLAASATIAKGRYEDAIQGASTVAMNEAPKSAPAIADATTTDAAGQERAEPVKAGPVKPGETKRTDEKVPREIAAMQAKIQANPTNANAYLHLAAVYRRADQFEQARQVLTAALGPTANHFDIAMELADLDIEPFRRDLAVAEEKLRRQPQDQELQTIRTRLANEIASRELEFFRQKADRYPTDAASRFEMGVRLLQCGQGDEAIRELQAIRNDPRHKAKALVYLGYCFQSRNNWRLAQRNFEEALSQLSAGDEKYRKEILYQLAKGYAQTGEHARAVDLACELANLDFSYKDIGKLLDEWQQKVTG